MKRTWPFEKVPCLPAFNMSLFLIEVCFAIEVTAAIVVAPSIVRTLGLQTESTAWIINSYLAAVFVVMLFLLGAQRALAKRVRPEGCFHAGIWMFVAGNACCWWAHSPSWFFAGRILQGVGGALAMTGELWAASRYCRERITTPLFWAECGTALGVVVGPALGGLLAGYSAEGWRMLFAMNAFLGLATALTAFIGLPFGLPDSPAAPGKTYRPAGWMIWIIVLQGAVSALAVGAEFLFSDVLQLRWGYGPRAVGCLGLLASIGAIAGSGWMTRQKGHYARCALAALGALIPAHILLAVALARGLLPLMGASIIAIGVAMGVANVAVYAEIAKRTQAIYFLPSTLWYLIIMQLGYALGIQITSWSQETGLTLSVSESVVIIAALLPILVVSVVRLADSWRTKNAES